MGVVSSLSQTSAAIVIVLTVLPPAASLRLLWRSGAPFAHLRQFQIFSAFSYAHVSSTVDRAGVSILPRIIFI